MSTPLLRDYEKEYDLEDYPPSPASSPLALPSSSSSRRSKTRLRRPLLHYIVASLVISLSLFLLLHFFSASPPRIQTAAGPDGALGEGEPVKTFWEGTPRDNRLQELVQNYNREKEGFGVGHASLPLYRSEMLQALEQLVGVAGGRAVDEVDGVVVPLREALSCYLDVECAESHPIPNELFATAKIVDPLPAELGTWQSLNPSHSLRLFNNAQVASWVASRFPNSTIPTTFDTLPMPILKYDLFRLLVLLTRGGTYTDADTTALRPIADWTRGVVDLTDPVLALHPPSSSARESNPPSLIVGVEWSGHTERNPLNPLYTRSVGIVQWTFGASAGHPVILDATQRVVENSRKVAEGEYPGVEGDEARLHFDPEAARAVLEWSGPAVLSDAVARYLRTRWGVSLATLASQKLDHPIRIGDVVLLPIAALQAQESYLRKAFDWALGRNFAPFTREWDLVQHEHAASWWTQKPKHEEGGKQGTAVARER